MSDHDAGKVGGLMLGKPVVAWSNGDLFSESDIEPPQFIRLTYRPTGPTSGGVQVGLI